MVIKCKIKVEVNSSKSSISFNVQNDIKNISSDINIYYREDTFCYLEQSKFMSIHIM